MKKILFIIGVSFLTACSGISQKVTYDQVAGIAVETYTNGLWEHGPDDFYIKQYVEPNQVDSVKKLQMQIAEEYIKIADN